MTSPVIRADSKFYGTPPLLCVDVRFKTTQELDSFIQALETLKNQNCESSDHVHLQDINFKMTTIQSTSAEVTFWRPGVSRDEDSLLATERFFRSLEISETEQDAAANP